MPEIDQLPMPDWGLRCPGCNAALAGSSRYACPKCGRRFNLVSLLARQRPIPDLGLVCPHCDYLLTGLTEERCPECGNRFSIRELLEDRHNPAIPDLCLETDPRNHHRRRRDPAFTGRERPLPDFGLFCDACEAPLAGAADDRCPACGQAFDLERLLQSGTLIDVSQFVSSKLGRLTKSLLDAAEVPYLVDNTRLYELGVVSIVAPRMWVPREFFFDALHCLAVADRPSAEYADQDWRCPQCDEVVPAGFEVCWSCGSSHPRANGSQEDQ